MKMKIEKIKWNGRMKDVTYLGEKVGNEFVYDEAEVRSYGYDYAKEIIEESPTVYLIHFNSGKTIRVFNPIEVTFFKS